MLSRHIVATPDKYLNVFGHDEGLDERAREDTMASLCSVPTFKFCYWFDDAMAESQELATRVLGALNDPHLASGEQHR